MSGPILMRGGRHRAKRRLIGPDIERPGVVLAGGVLLVVAGYLAAFTVAGALVIAAGLGFVVAGALRLLRVPWVFAAAAGLALAAGGAWYTLAVYPG